MTPDYTFVQSELDLQNSLVEFNRVPELWRQLVGNSPLYFVHSAYGSNHFFGLSKFCAFKDITVEEYLTSDRYKTDGGTTQKHIVWATNKKWTAFHRNTAAIQKAFTEWITQFFPNYAASRAHFITIANTECKPASNFLLSPEVLAKRLKSQEITGRIGEEIALAYEINRLEKTGISDASGYVKQISLTQANAGYDIISETNLEKRLIEVKSSVTKEHSFFISENELRVLERNGDHSYLYLVHITDLKNKEGQIVRIVKNPVPYLKNEYLKPVLFKAVLSKI